MHVFVFSLGGETTLSLIDALKTLRDAFDDDREKYDIDCHEHHEYAMRFHMFAMHHETIEQFVMNFHDDKSFMFAMRDASLRAIDDIKMYAQTRVTIHEI